MRAHIIVPTERNLRFHRRLARWATGIAVVGTLLLVWAGSAGSGRHALVLGPVVLVISLVIMVYRVRGIAGRLETQLHRLAGHGQPHAAERVTVEKMQRGNATHFHVVVARFRARDGVWREALSETFDYDPSPLLDPVVVDVIADTSEPDLCVVSNATLPPRARKELAPAQLASLPPLPRWLTVATWIARAALFGMVAWTSILLWKIFG